MSATPTPSDVSRLFPPNRLQCRVVAAQIWALAAKLRREGKDPTSILRDEYMTGVTPSRALALPWAAFGLELHSLVADGLLSELQGYLDALKAVEAKAAGVLPRAIGKGLVLQGQAAAVQVYGAALRSSRAEYAGLASDLEAMAAGGATEALSKIEGNLTGKGTAFTFHADGGRRTFIYRSR